MLPRTLVLTVALATTAWAAAETAPIAVAGGVCYRYDRDARAVTDEGGGFSWTEDYGTHFVIGASAPERAFIGYPWLDIDWARSSGAGSRIDTLGVLYIERIPLGDGPYIGLGPGSFYNNARIRREGLPTERAAKWRIGGRAVVGWNLPLGLYLEGGYSLSGKVLGVKTDSADLSLGIRF